MSKKFTLALVEHCGYLYAFERRSNRLEYTWQSLLIKGEKKWPLESDASWQLVLNEINDQLNRSSKLAEGWVYWLLEETTTEATKRLLSLNSDFQIHKWSLLNWQGLNELGLITKPKTNQDLNQWLIDQLTRLLAPVSAAAEIPEPKKGPQANTAEVDLIDHLAQEKLQLKSENIKLEEQLQTLQNQIEYLKDRIENSAASQMNIETLVSYLPILYKNFWGQIRPDELAMLAGTMQIPEIPSPMREPGSGVVQIMKKRLQQLPIEQQNQLRQFCQQLPHASQVRPEMAFFFEADD